MTSYIVRIHRRGVGEEEIVGTVAAPGREGRTPFRGFQELIAILQQDNGGETPPPGSDEHLKGDT